MKNYLVTGMSCSACAARVEKSVSVLPGVKKAEVNLLTRTLKVEGNISDDIIYDAVKKAGYGLAPYTDDASLPKEKGLSLKNRLIISACFLVPLFIVAMGSMMGIPMKFLTDRPVLFAGVQLALTIPIIVINFSYFTNGTKSLFKGSPNMNTLISVGSGVAFLYGLYAFIMIIVGTAKGDHATVHSFMHNMYFESAGMILTLITLGKFLEGRSKGKTTAAIEKLLRLAPDTATVVTSDGEIVLPLSEIKVGDVVKVTTGERIPLDGVITAGKASVDTSTITGESIPRDADVGAEAISGTLVVSGYIEFKVTAVGEDTVLKKIVRLVEEASSSKAPISRLADKISGVFVPVVMSISLITFIVWMCVGKTFPFALNMAISVLVISCPCALGLATPVAIMVGTGKGAENGILIKNAESLELLHKINCIIFDKTGTITEGRPAVENFYGDEHCLSIAYSLEKTSSHPLSAAVVAYAEERNVPALKTVDFVEIAGKGLSGKINGKQCYVGNKNFLTENGVEVPETNGFTVIHVAEGNDYLGYLDLSDPVKPDSAKAVAELKAMGIKTVILTGDNKRSAEKVFAEVQTDEYISDVLPADKESVVRNYREQGLKVAMVGDGINDAPALTRADVGIAIGAGTDIAIDSADIVLVKNSLADVVRAINLSKQTLRVIKQNLFWAFGYNVLGIPVAAGVLYPISTTLVLNPMIAAACMSLSSVSVVLNALRLSAFGKKKNKQGENTMKTVHIEGMMCQHCVNHVKTALLGIEGITSAEVNLEKKTAVINDCDVSDEVIKAKIAEAGYKVTKIK